MDTACAFKNIATDALAFKPAVILGLDPGIQFSWMAWSSQAMTGAEEWL